MSSENKSEVYFNDFIENLHNKPATVLQDKDYYLQKYSFLRKIINILPCSLYLLDYQTQTYWYVSEEVKNLMGYTAEEVMQNGHPWTLGQLHPDDLKEFTGSVFEEFVSYSHSLSREQLENTRFSVNYRFKHKEGHYVQFLDNHIIIDMDESNNPILILGIVTDITPHKKDSRVVFSISEYNSSNGSNELISTKSFPKSIEFTKREKEIIVLLGDGNSSKEIASMLNVSVHTVNTHRKNLLEKYDFKNTSELLSYSMANGIV